jgi:hypothetical protein
MVDLSGNIIIGIEESTPSTLLSGGSKATRNTALRKTRPKSSQGGIRSLMHNFGRRRRHDLASSDESSRHKLRRDTSRTQTKPRAYVQQIFCGA